MKKFIFLLMLWALTAPAFCSGIQIDALVSGLRNPLTDSFLSGGLVYTYAAGTTASKSVYMDAALTTASTNPIVLDAYGRALRFANGKYKFVIKTSGGTLLWTLDNLEYSSVTTFASTTVNPFGASLAVTNFRTAALTATLAADLNANGYAIKNIATPTSAYDVSTKGYTDSSVASVASDLASVTTTVGVLVARPVSFDSSPDVGSSTWELPAGVTVTSVSTWTGVDTFTYTNTSTATVKLFVTAKGTASSLKSYADNSPWVGGTVALVDGSGVVYDASHLHVSVTVATNSGALLLQTPFHLSANIDIPASSSKSIGVAAKADTDRNITIYLSSNARWYSWLRTQ